jgi:hypothetical protein
MAQVAANSSKPLVGANLKFEACTRHFLNMVTK